MTYVWIPPGSFTIVSRPILDDEDVRARLNWDQENSIARLHNLHTEEGPVAMEDWPELGFRAIAHRVTLTRGFWMGQTPVTQEAYEKVTGSNPSELKGAGLPVHCVSWNQAKAYCEAIGMRLPTEAEWEYAARCGVTSIAILDPARQEPSSADLDELAWHYGNSASERERRTRWTPQAVGGKRPNEIGLHDMLGNVWEWVADCFWEAREPESSVQRLDLLPPELGEDLTDPQRTPAGEYRVVRGGSYLSRPETLSASCRRVVAPNTVVADVGFRCVGTFGDS